MLQSSPRGRFFGARGTPGKLAFAIPLAMFLALSQVAPANPSSLNGGSRALPEAMTLKERPGNVSIPLTVSVTPLYGYVGQTYTVTASLPTGYTWSNWNIFFDIETSSKDADCSYNTPCYILACNEGGCPPDGYTCVNSVSATWKFTSPGHFNASASLGDASKPCPGPTQNDTVNPDVVSYGVVQNQSSPPPSNSPSGGSGTWGVIETTTLVLGVAAVVAVLVLLVIQRTRRRHATGASVEPSQAVSQMGRFCPVCGTTNDPSYSYCLNCREQLP